MVLLEIRHRTDGTLALFEPDFQSMPVRFVDGVSNTLLHLFLQKSVAESLAWSRSLPSPSCATAPSSAPSSVRARVCHEQVSPKAADSGWFFGCDSRVHDISALKVCGAFRFMKQQSVTMTASSHSSVSADAFVGFGGGVPYFSRGEEELAIRPGSYLHRKYDERAGRRED